MPLIWIAGAYFGGLIAADIYSGPLFVWSAGVGACFTLLVVWKTFWQIRASERIKHFPLTLIWILGVTFFTAGFHYQRTLPDLNDSGYIAYYADREQKVSLQGDVCSDPDTRDSYTQFMMQTRQIWRSAHSTPAPVKGKVLIRVPPGHRIRYGDRLLVQGYLTTPPHGEEFSYRDYLARKGVYARISPVKVEVLDHRGGNLLLKSIFDVKTRALKVVYRLWPDPEASLLAGILLGEEGGIPEDVEEDFQETGTSHIIVISGFNITIVAGFFITFFGRLFKPGWGALTAAVGIGLYTLLVGADPAVVRAALMGGLGLFARQIGRRQHSLNAVAGASLMMAVFNPQLPWDVSFQLSLAATLGLILYAEPFSRGFRRLAARVMASDLVQRTTRPVSEFILYTLAAQLTTIPVLLFHFQRLSWIAPLANPFILPVQPPIMVLGGMALMLGMVWFPLGKYCALIVFPFISYTIRAVEYFAHIQVRSVSIGKITMGGLVVLYGVLALITFGRRHAGFYRRHIQPSLLAGILILGNILVWRGVLQAPDGYFHVSFFDVGTGSAILLTAPQGERVLINGGPSSSALSSGIGRRVPIINRELDLLVVASPLAEDIGGLPVFVERYPPHEVLWLGSSSPSRAADYLRQTLQELEVPVLEGQPGSTVEIGNDIRIEIISRSDRGGLLLITYGGFRGLMPFAISKESIQTMRNGLDIGHVSVLLLADNGHAANNPQEWIQHLNPRLGVVSVSSDDRQGHPSPALLRRMAGYSLLRTDLHGWVEITTDGKRMWINVENFP